MPQTAQRKKMNGFFLYWRYIRLHFLSGLQYKGWFLMVIQVIFVVITDPIGTIFLFSRFGSIGAWSMERILLIYSMAITSFGLSESLARGFDSFPWKMVQNGGFDLILLRPRSTFVQVAASVFHIHRLARVASGLIAIAWCLVRLGVAITPWRLFLLLYALAGGCLLYTGVFVLTSGLSFFTIKGLNWIYILTNASYQVTRCPMEYMPQALRTIFVFLVPVMVVSYYPSSVICGWGEPVWTGLLALPAGFAFLGLSFFMWRVGVRHYKSTGS